MSRTSDHAKFWTHGKVSPLSTASDCLLVIVLSVLIFSKSMDQHAKTVMDVALHLIEVSRHLQAQAKLQFLGYLASRSSINGDRRGHRQC